jgi:cyclophilin family peptidyl-prolyl cis-trans isomerase
MVRKLKHEGIGTLSMAIAGEADARGCGSQFFFTLGENLEYLDGKHAGSSFPFRSISISTEFVGSCFRPQQKCLVG